MYRNKSSLIHALNIDILNKWLKFENDRLSRSGDIVGTDFENVVMKKTRLKFCLPTYIRFFERDFLKNTILHMRHNLRPPISIFSIFEVFILENKWFSTKKDTKCRLGHHVHPWW